ncbi:MAG: hypothetical protein MUC54_02575 [Chloroflexi bacterium]|jgi:hypothetical protein|nr:hypothetical protein [Chloroflexota bacterium]
MAMIRVEPVEVRVRTDWLSGRPREIRWGDRVLPVTAIAAVRRESRAFRAGVGPRTCFEVETPDTRLVLAFRHRSRRWLVEGLDERRTAA